MTHHKIDKIQVKNIEFTETDKIKYSMTNFRNHRRSPDDKIVEMF